MNRFGLQRTFATGDQGWRLAALLLVFMVVAAIFGGASRLNELRLAVVELAALPLLALGTIAVVQGQAWRGDRLAFGILAALVAIPLLQLVPLPPGTAMGLPGRDQLRLAMEITGLAAGWQSLSLTPDFTWRAALALIPPVAAFLAVVALGPRWVSRWVAALLCLTAISLALGAAQLASGGTRLYLWPTTDAGDVAGFFANRNHLASLVLVTVPLAAVIAGREMERRSESRRLAGWLATLYVAFAVIALGVIRSRAGIILAGPVVCASLLAAWVAAGRGRPSPLFLTLASGAAAAAAAVALFAIGPILARFDPATNSDNRLENWPTVIEAAQAYLPLGSGLGSFDAVYRSVEPLERLDANFFNHAHNEYLETWLETGWLGVALIVVFTVWLVRRGWRAWRSSGGPLGDVQRAASIAIVSLMGHSIFDYPLRTETLAVTMAMICGLLVIPPSGEPIRTRSRRRVSRRQAD